MEFCSVTTDGAVCTITLNRPDKRNAVHGPMALELRIALRYFEVHDELRVAVLTGAGAHFCAGADLTAMADPALRNELDPSGGGDGPMGPTRMACSKPLIAALEGYAVAGGLELALLADLRVAAKSAVLGVFCRRWGVPLIDGGTVRLPRLIGMGRALDMILTGRAVSAQEALEFGLVNRVTEDGQALAVALELARQIAGFPQQCLATDRNSVYAQADLTLSEALRNEGKQGVAVVLQEGLAGAAQFAAGAGRHGEFT